MLSGWWSGSLLIASWLGGCSIDGIVKVSRHTDPPRRRRYHSAVQGDGDELSLDLGKKKKKSKKIALDDTVRGAAAAGSERPVAMASPPRLPVPRKHGQGWVWPTHDRLACVCSIHGDGAAARGRLGHARAFGAKLQICRLLAHASSGACSRGQRPSQLLQVAVLRGGWLAQPWSSGPCMHNAHCMHRGAPCTLHFRACLWRHGYLSSDRHT